MSIEAHMSRAVILAFPAATALVLTLFLYRPRFLGTTWGPLLWLGAWAASATVTANRFGLLFGQHNRLVGQGDLRFALSGLCAGLLIVFAVPFVVRLYGKWVVGSITEQEKAPGAMGVRAWLGGWNVVLAAAISLCAWQGYEYSFWGVLAMTLGLLLAYPAVTTLSGAGGPPLPAVAPPPQADLSDERERVLKLLEDGKITAEEGAELLGALGQTAAPAPPPAPTAAMTSGRKLLLLGALLVIVGFFLPWYSINIGQEMNRATRIMSDFGNQTSESVGAPPMPAGGMPSMSVSFSTNTARIAGGDVDHGFGWIVLLLGVLAAALPFVKLNVSPQAQKMLLAAPLAAGGFIIVYLLTRDLRHVSFGLPVVLAGYAVEFIGLLKDRRCPA